MFLSTVLLIVPVRVLTVRLAERSKVVSARFSFGVNLLFVMMIKKTIINFHEFLFLETDAR